MTTTFGGQARRFRLPAALLTAALIATPTLATPAFAAPPTLTATTVGTGDGGPGGESTPEPAQTAAPVSGEGVEQVSVSGVDKKAAADDESRAEATTQTAPNLLDTDAVIAAPDRSAAVAEADPADDSQLAALSSEQSTGNFTAAGVTWVPDKDDEVIEAAVRLREEGTWSEWTSLELLSAEAAGDVAGTEPLLSLGADGIQTRVLTASGKAPENLKVNLVAAGSSPTDGMLRAGPSPSDDGAALKPSVVTRAQWGANESQANTTTRRSVKLQAMYVHHTASTNNYTKAQAYQQLRSIYNYHTNVLKWDDIGYQFLVDRFGTIYEGRRGSMTDLVVGAQAGGYNANTIGISAMGNFDIAAPPAATVEALTKVLAWKGYQYNLDAKGTTTLTTTTAGPSTARGKNGSQLKVPVILGHRDTNFTACPGRYLYPKLGSIREEVSKRISQAKTAYGNAGATLKAPVAAGNYSAVTPVTPTGKITLSWKPVAKAASYQVMVRSGQSAASVSDERLWWAAKTTAGTSVDVTIAAGQTAVFGIRAVDGSGRVSATTKLVQSSRPAGNVVTKWTTAGLNLRTSATTSSKALLVIPKGTQLSISATSGSWSKTSYGGKTGWVHGAYLSSVSIPVAKPVAKQYRYAAMSTRLLKSANSSAGRVRSLPLGTKVELLDTSGDWSKVKLGSATGWVKSYKLSTEAPKAQQYRYAAISTRLLKSASSSAGRVASLPQGEKTELLNTSGGWSNVKLGSATGWVKSSKLSSAAPQGAYYRYAAISTRLLTSAGSGAGRVASLPQGEKVQMLQTDNGWSKVKLGSHTGWVKSTKLSTKAPTGTHYRYAAISTRLLTSAGSGAGRVRSLPQGTKVQMLQTDNGWSKVKLGSKTGWVKSFKLSTRAR